jgi:hypothetical protein
MARPKNPFGSWPKITKPRKPRNPFAPPKVEEPPAPRQPLTEQLLCQAIQRRNVVSLYYDGGAQARSFEPTAVYHSTKNKVCVSGIQRGDGPKNLEVGKISGATITGDKFQPDPRFDRFDPKYRNGIICSV